MKIKNSFAIGQLFEATIVGYYSEWLNSMLTCQHKKVKKSSTTGNQNIASTQLLKLSSKNVDK